MQFPFLDKTVYHVEKITLCDHGDFALLRTRKAVKGAAVIGLYDGADETDNRAWIGSYGLSGPTGTTTGVGRFHAGHNRIDRIRTTLPPRHSRLPSRPNQEPCAPPPSTGAGTFFYQFGV